MDKGFDVWYRKGSVNFKQSKAAGIDFIIPRDGWGTNDIDYKLIEYVEQAKAAGIEVPAVFHFVYGINKQEVIENAKCAIRNVQKAGLPKSTIIFVDIEDDTIDNARDYRGVKLTNSDLKNFAIVFCDYVLSQGYCTGIYTNKSYIEYVYGRDIMNRYDIWLADLEGGPDYPCVFQQYDFHGTVPGCGSIVDLDRFYGNYTAGTAKIKEEIKTMSKVDSYISALKALGDGRYRYYDDTPSGIGCSEYTRRALINAGIINSSETFHAGNGIIGVLADRNRFDCIAWDPHNLKKGDILWSHGHHVATWDGSNGVYEAAPESSHGICDNGKTGVGHWTNHTYRNCGTNSNTWTCIYRIKENTESKSSGKPMSKTYVKVALETLDRNDLEYLNEFPYNCGYYTGSKLRGDCWNINPKATTWSLYLNDPISKNYTKGKYYYKEGIAASGLQDVTGDYILNNYCAETTFSKMLALKKAPCFLLINGAHMGAYLGDFERDGKVYNVSEFSPNANLGGKMRSYVDEYGRRLTHKGGAVIGTWNRCGYLTAFLDYSDWETNVVEPVVQPAITIETPEGEPATVTVDNLAREIYAGKWGNNPGRQQSITNTYGADVYKAAQKRVDHFVSAMNWYREEIKLAEQILNKEWGNNPERQNNITLKYGANAYRIAQSFVNDICAGNYTVEDLYTSLEVASRIISGSFGNGEERKQRIIAEYGVVVRDLAQGIVNDIFK